MMQRYIIRARALASFLILPRHRSHLRYASTAVTGEKADERLRILFCGSDQFSVYSLRALAQYACSPGSNIASIDVVTRKDKPTGRGLRHVESPIIKHVALELQLPLHQIDTFTGWSPPPSDATGTVSSAINLVVAVSFGLLVPSRILRSATYGGLNVHPSLLPRLKGAAPIEWTILNGLKETGVTLQSLHESKFDEGLVLDQVAVSVEDPDACSFVQLREQLGHIGAALLVKGLREKRYLSDGPVLATSKCEASYAPKLSKRHLAINPELHSATQLMRMWRTFGKLFAHTEDVDGLKVRVVVGKARVLKDQDLPQEAIDIVRSIPVGLPYSMIKSGQNPQHSEEPVQLKTRGGVLIIESLTVSGSAPGPATASAARRKLLKHLATFRDASGESGDIYTFCAPLSGEADGLPTIAASSD